MAGRTLSDIARELDGELLGDVGDLVISGVSGLEDAGPDDLSFVTRSRRGYDLGGCQAGALLVGPQFTPDRPAIRVEDPQVAFAQLLAHFLPDPDLLYPPGVHATAVVAPDADIAGAVSIGPYCVIGSGVKLGRGTRIGSHVIIEAGVSVGTDCTICGRVTICHRCRVENRVILHTGVVIGSDGFGYLPSGEGRVKIPQVGIVVIEDDVEIGAGSCVDRAVAGRTVVGAGTKVDNLVQIGHNVKIGRHCALSAQMGIAGTSVLGDGVVAGGQVGVGDHLHIGAGAKLGGKSGVWRDVPAGTTVFGYPALNIKETFRITSAMRKLPELIKSWRKFEAGRDSSEDQE